MPDRAPLRPEDPEHVREYRLTARLGEGGQGTVYLGESPTGARVAVKLLRADLTQDAEAMERFVREVSTTRRVSPFCTAAVLDTGVDHHRPYIVSEYIDGPTLQEVVTTEGPREGAVLHRLAIGTVTALVAIHQAEIVHRDFKPSNVLLAPDGPRVIDFGIAKALDRTSTLTGTAIGTPAYMTPEQLEGKNAGSPADMFAWGCTMVFAATGAPPFGTDSLAAIFNRIMNLTPDLSAITDPALRELVGHCLAKDPTQRPTASEALMRLLGHATGASGMTGEASTGSALPAAPQGILAQGSAVAAQHTGPGPNGYPPGTLPGAAFLSPPARVEDRTWYGSGSTGGQPYPAEQHRHPQQNPPPQQAYHQAGPGPGPGPQQAYHQTHSGAPTFPSHPAAPYQGAVAAAYPPQGAAPAKSRRGLWAAVGGFATVVLVAGGIVAVVNNGSSDTPATPRADRTGQATGRSTPGPTPAPVPTADQEIKLPDSSITIHESYEDPIKLTSYTLARGDDYSLYIRETNTRQFVKNNTYRDYVLNSSGTQALATNRDYDSNNEEYISIVDVRTGGASAVRITKSPFYATSPQWSPDGTKGMFNLYETDEEPDIAPQLYGYAIVDIATKKATVVPVKGIGIWPFFWRADSRAIGAWLSDVDTKKYLRFYDLQGTPLQTLRDVGEPIWIDGESVSPSGALMITSCPETNEICLRSTTATAGGEPKVRIPFWTERIICWYDDRHIVAWQQGDSGQEAVVIDFKGRVKRVLATNTESEDTTQQAMSFTRTG
ncbi:putative Ser/Thr protein kinase [Streptosporangium becharense]|uniref:non-specific serine/threonine protein kinase n=1 Tax=Streptosporangium becharense TaxID=1816182 RepID=A0A7W9IF10_9ACTN|nr:serine/threonine-protein kinase [Streptosporangium becharense]MBB2909499.1 putative Ser/Thr protein kinase [Streptosporangium becharense]MBB5819544.1 putative Ser/Thr protein kinase [Streptosporangium becharense]